MVENEKAAIRRLKKVENNGVEPMTFPMLRDALSFVVNDLFYEFSAFHFLNNSFTLSGFASGGEIFELFQFPRHTCFGRFISATIVLCEPCSHILTRANIILVGSIAE